MIKHLSIVFLLVFFFGIENLISQNDSIKFEPEDEKRLHEFHNNKDYLVADKYVAVGKSSQARVFFQKAIDLFEINENWDGFIEAAGELVHTYVGAQNFQEGVDYAQQILEKINRVAPQKRLKCSLIYHNMGIVYDVSRQTESALNAFETELALLKEKYVIDTSYQFGLTYNSIAIVHANFGDLHKALSYFLKAKDVYLNATDCEACKKSKLSETYNNIGIVYYYTGNFEGAIKTYQKGLELAIASNGENSLKLVNDYTNIATLYITIGELDLAIEYLNKAASIIENLSGNKEISLQKDLLNIYNKVGSIFATKNESSKALSYLNRVEKQLKNASDNHSLFIDSNLEKGRVYFNLKEYDSALSYYQKADSLLAIDLTLTDNESNRFNLGTKIKFGLAETFVKTENLAEAKKHYRKVFDFLVKTNHSRHRAPTLIYKNLANIFDLEGQLDSALIYNQKAVINSTKTFDNIDILALPKIDDFNEITEIYEILSQKADLLKKYGLIASTDQEVIFSAALAAIELADKLHVENLKKTSLLRGNKIETLAENSIGVYQEGIKLLHQSPEFSSSLNKVEKGFYFAQKMKAQQLWSSLQKSDATKLGNIDNSLLEKERSLLTKIHYYENLVLDARKNQDSIRLNLYENGYLFNIKNDYRNLLKEMENSSPQYFNAKYAFVPSTIEDLKRVVKENEIIIEYVLIEDALFVFIIDKMNAPTFQKIPLNPQTSKTIQSFNKLLRKSIMARTTSREKFIKLSHELYQQFVEPIEDQLAGKERLIIIGDGMTNYIPFEVLLKSNESKPFTELDYLMKHHEISYHYSATLFAKTKEKEITDNTGIYAFAPVYEDGEGNLLASRKRNQIVADTTLRAFDADGNYQPLPESEKEVKSIIELFKNNGTTNTTLALREDATENSLKTNLENPFKFIHIAGHSFADLENPKFSGIACFEETKESVEDGTLYTGEIYNISSQADLVTLSSCESGFGKLEKTEGLLGLNRAFIYSGAPNVVFSLWKIYDKVSAELMVDFYQEILDGKSYSAALRAAKLKLLEKETTASPHFWSPFLLIGR